jgi:hypothetical protein
MAEQSAVVSCQRAADPDPDCLVPQTGMVTLDRAAPCQSGDFLFGPATATQCAIHPPQQFVWERHRLPILPAPAMSENYPFVWWFEHVTCRQLAV